MVNYYIAGWLKRWLLFKLEIYFCCCHQRYNLYTYIFQYNLYTYIFQIDLGLDELSRKYYLCSFWNHEYPSDACYVIENQRFLNKKVLTVGENSKLKIECWESPNSFMLKVCFILENFLKKILDISEIRS